MTYEQSVAKLRLAIFYLNEIDKERDDSNAILANVYNVLGICNELCGDDSPVSDLVKGIISGYRTSIATLKTAKNVEGCRLMFFVLSDYLRMQEEALT